MQETTPDGAFVYQGNAGEAKVKGVEFEFTAHPIQYLSASFAGSYQDAYLAQGATPRSTQRNPTLGLTGDDHPERAEVSAQTWASITRRPIAGAMGGHGGDGS